LDLHHTVFWILGRTFSLQPVATRWQMPDWEFVTGSVSSSVENGFLMIAPVGIVMFVTLVTLLVTMRTAPQFNFMSYGMAMRVLAGLGGLLLFLPDVCGAMQRLLYRIGMGIIG
ncbi:MAG: flagellar biosynthetic protein FliR, partial [Planctomycetaceae bacterium]|nr:flagellar biosynthetic protein FliR [Planctomycetaceae bacterium]